MGADTNTDAPLVILIHGGCWLNSFDVNHSRPLATALNHAGFAVLSLEYRRTGDPGGGWPSTLEDIQLALCGGGEHDCIEVAALLLLAWEGRLDADLLPLARHAALAVAALCEGPCDANQRALLASPAPASRAPAPEPTG